MTSAFDISRSIGNNFSKGVQKGRDESIIEDILSNAMQTNDPAVLQKSIGTILSKVSPERQGAAIQYLQSAYANIEQKQQQQRSRQAAVRGNYDPDAPEAIQKIQYENQSLDKRAKNIMGGNKPIINENEPIPNEKIQNQNEQSQGLRDLSDEQLIALSGVKGYAEPAKQELKRRQEATKEDRADVRALKQETLPVRVDIANKANSARKGIQNKTNLLNIIDQGNLDDPTWAIIADNLPLNLGKRLLSEDSVVYKSALVDEFSDLRNIFQGQTRVKEIELLQEKLADLYLTDQQKKSILKSRINALQTDVIREEAAAEVEKKYPKIGILEFSKKV